MLVSPMPFRVWSWRLAFPLPLRAHLAILVVVAVLPVLLFAALMVAVFGHEQRAFVERGVRDTARTLTFAVDRELATSLKTLEALAASELLDRGELRAFHRHLVRAVPTQRWWRVAFLVDATGRRLLDTTMEFEATQGTLAAASEQFSRVVATGEPSVSDLVPGAETVAMVVPVIRHGTLRYALGAGLDVALLNRFLREQWLPHGWSGVVLDRQNRILAGTGSLERRVGTRAEGMPARPELAESWRRGVDVTGRRSYLAYSRAPVSGWTVAVAVPVRALDSPLLWSLLSVAGGGLLLLGAGVMLAIVVGRRTAEPINTLVRSAAALGRGETGVGERSSVLEVDRLASAIQGAGHDRDRFERALRASEGQLRAVFDAALDGLLLADDDGRYVDANPAAEALLGVPRAELLGRTIGDFLDGGGDFETAWRQFRERRRETGQVRLRRPDGSTRDVEYCAVADVLPGCHLSALRDVTDRLRAEAERNQLLAREQAARADAESANRAKDEFLATLSHELRTPLTSMLGWVRLLREETLSEDRVAHALESIERNTRLQAKLINDMLDVSRIVAGKLQLDLRTVDLPQIVDDAVESIRAEAERKAIALERKIDPAAGPVRGDAVRLQQIVGNLLTNALKFTPAGGRVDVRVERQDASAHVIVSDSGIGIDPQVLPHVFDRFRQADSTSSRKHGGLGLGLAIARHLTALHGGTVRAESPGLGEGATFTIALPIVPADGDAAPDRDVAAERAASGLDRTSLRGIRVLVVDDDADSREVVRTVLERCGGEVLIASSADGALAMLRWAQVDIVVSDLAMPGTSGLELVDQMRAGERAGATARVPAVALSAHATSDDRARALAAGFDAHAAKPIDPDDLVAVVTRTLAKAA